MYQHQDGRLLRLHRKESPRQDSNDNYRSRTERESSLEEPLPPDVDSAPSSPSSRSQSSRHRHHQKSTNQTSNLCSNGVIETSQPGGHGFRVESNPPPPPSIAANTHIGTKRVATSRNTNSDKWKAFVNLVAISRVSGTRDRNKRQAGSGTSCNLGPNGEVCWLRQSEQEGLLFRAGDINPMHI